METRGGGEVGWRGEGSGLIVGSITRYFLSAVHDLNDLVFTTVLIATEEQSRQPIENRHL